MRRKMRPVWKKQSAPDAVKALFNGNQENIMEIPHSEDFSYKSKIKKFGFRPSLLAFWFLLFLALCEKTLCKL